MKTHDHDASRLDVQAFAKAGDTLEGECALADLPRLAASAVATREAEPVSWQARGELRAVRAAPAQVWLHVRAGTTIHLECQRCLQPVSERLDAQRSFLFVHGEATAAELDADSEDDVLALTRSLDLHELIEDELLLSLPLVPRHEVCPQPLVVPEDVGEAPDDRPNPFAALAGLKAPRGH